ncbi:MAG TPA: hypothetical protein VMU95_23275 [Trebonia sp.]|nr:hypothetical protein [Trebonia sp.]
MITADQAERIAAEFMEALPDQTRTDWHLREFPQGWLIAERREEPLMGAASYVVERDSGRIMMFPSFIAPVRILEEYEQVAARGLPHDSSPAS